MRLNATCMVLFGIELKMNISGECPNVVLLLAVYPVTCCIHPRTFALISVCGDGGRRSPVHLSCPTAHASLEIKLSEWLWEAILVHIISTVIYSLCLLRCYRSMVCLSSLRQILCLTCVLGCHRCVASQFVLHILDDTTGHSLSIKNKRFFLTLSSTSMVCWLLPVTQFHSQVSVLSSKPEDLSHSTQQAAHPHGHSHRKRLWWVTVARRLHMCHSLM